MPWCIFRPYQNILKIYMRPPPLKLQTSRGCVPLFKQTLYLMLHMREDRLGENGLVLTEEGGRAAGSQPLCSAPLQQRTHTHTHGTHTHTHTGGECSRWGASTSQRCHFSVSCSGRSALTFYEALCRNQQLVMAAGLSLPFLPSPLPPSEPLLKDRIWAH